MNDPPKPASLRKRRVPAELRKRAEPPNGAGFIRSVKKSPDGLAGCLKYVLRRTDFYPVRKLRRNNIRHFIASFSESINY